MAVLGYCYPPLDQAPRVELPANTVSEADMQLFLKIFYVPTSDQENNLRSGFKIFGHVVSFFAN
ncbi:Dynein alpha chain, flagellar outer arm [Frankliniella fusca]|uniref:Dynein alpha chain, flagellar outer arm n=1 Tax=Frankliniella fusca TaxID=407009 RepID=A0AAE1GRH8_9NEOP|nr:Dynein alpha chain, flagellar outer arm [Frankliniella fusca]